jgi:hypothetical protein
MAKRFLAFIAALVFFLPVTAYTENAVATLQDMYSQAELKMATGDYSGAGAQFDALGAYSDSSQMAMYCKALEAAETLNLYDIAIDAFVKLGDFKDCLTRLKSCQDNMQAVDNEIKTRRENQLEEIYPYNNLFFGKLHQEQRNRGMSLCSSAVDTDDDFR